MSHPPGPSRRSLSFVAILFLVATSSFCPVAVSAVRSRLTWVNGIAHNLDHMEDGRVSISSFFGGKPVEFCHNPTSMTSEDDYVGYIGDLTQAGTQKLGRITGEVDELVRHLRDAVKSVGKSGRVVHIAHSQGALITSLAAKRLSEEELSRIEVIAFGGGVAMRRSDIPFARCINYYSTNDPLLVMVPSAVKALRSGFLGVCSRGHPSVEPEFVFLTPRANDPILDHGLMGPTYQEALAWEGRRFQRQYQPLAYRVGRSAVLEVVVFCKAVSDRTDLVVRAILKRAVIPLVILALKLVRWVKGRSIELRQFLGEKVFPSLVTALHVLGEIVKEAYRMWRGEDVYEPVPASFDKVVSFDKVAS